MTDYKVYYVGPRDEYPLEEFSDGIPIPGTSDQAHDGCYVEPMFKNPPNQKFVDNLLSVKDRERNQKYLGDDLASFDYYRVYGDPEGLIKYLRRVVKFLIDLIPRLDCEDDHDYFYSPALKFVAQLSEIANAPDELKPLRDALKALECEYCNTPKCNLYKFLTIKERSL